MPVTVSHVLSATTPDDPSYEIQPKHWNSGHALTLSLVGSEVVGVFSNANGISFSTEPGGFITASYTVPSVPAQTVQTQASGAIAGSGFSSQTTAGVDIKGTHNSAGLNLGVPAYLTTAQPVGAYLTTARASTDAVGLNTALTANGVSWTVNSSGISLNVPVFLTTARASTDAVGLNTALTANGVAWTVNSSGISLNVPAFLTTARGSTDALGLGTAKTNVTWTANSAGLSLDAGGYAGTGFTSTTTAGTDVKGTHNTVGLSMAFPAWLTTAQAPGAYLTTARGSTDAIGLNTALTANGVSVTANSSGLSLNFPAFLTTAMASNASTQFVQANAVFAGTNASGTIASSGISVSVAAVATLSELEPIMGSALLTNSTLGQNTLYFVGFDVPQDLNAYRINFFQSIGTTLLASNSTNSAGVTFSAALYSRGVGASTERIVTFWSGSCFMRMQNSSNTQVAVTHPQGISNSTAVSTGGTVLSNANASSYIANSLGGYRAFPMPISSTLTAGRYWLAVAQSSNSSNAIGILQASVLQQTNGNNIAYRPFGTSSAASNASVFPSFPGDGTYSATSGAFPATIGLSVSDIRAPLVATIPYFNFSAYTTGTNLL